MVTTANDLSYREKLGAGEKVIKEMLTDSARNKLRNDLLTLGPIFAEYEYFMSEEFSLIDCYLAPLLWRLPQLGIDLVGPGSKEAQGLYESCVRERLFWRL